MNLLFNDCITIILPPSNPLRKENFKECTFDSFPFSFHNLHIGFVCLPFYHDCFESTMLSLPLKMQVLVYDLRSSYPVRIKDHMWVLLLKLYHVYARLGLANLLIEYLALVYRFDSPIVDIKWHQSINTERPKLITTDKHIVRIWDPETVRYIFYFLLLFVLL